MLALFVVCPFFLFGCGKTSAPLTQYKIFVEYNHQEKNADCFEVVSYVNNSNNVFEEVYFHLYPNAFREGSQSKVVSMVNFDKAYPNGESFGNITIEGVCVENQDCDFDVCGEDENLLRVPLAEKVYPGETVNISIDFCLKLPNINHRFGFGENVVNFGNFYPIACVYDEIEGFMTEKYISNGDPFYSDCADYEVTISCEDNFNIVTSGKEISKSGIKGRTTASYIAKSARDFCFVISDRYEVVQEEVDGVLVSYYYYDDENPQDFLQTGVDSLLTYSKLFGEYPYETLNIVKTGFVHGGMEYPGLVMISDAITNIQDYQYVIAHEVAHQWWYGAVGNNEYDEAWLDESLTEYSVALFYENNDYGISYNQIVKNATETYKQFVKVYSNVYENLDTSMGRALDEFKTEPEYVNCVYTKGILMFDAIRQEVGKERFLKALKKYFKEYKFKNASKDDLIAIFEQVSGRKMEGLINSWVEGLVAVI